MKRLLWIIGFCLLASSQAFCGELDPVKSIPSFKSLCIEEQSTGFNWEKGKWVPTRFIENKYIIQKINLSSVKRKEDVPFMCRKVLNEIPVFSNFNAYGCYLVKRIGDDNVTIQNSKTCDEYYDMNTKNLTSIRCEFVDNISFLPDGAFIKIPYILDLTSKPNNGYKDSMSIAVGTCSTLVE